MIMWLQFNYWKAKIQFDIFFGVELKYSNNYCETNHFEQDDKSVTLKTSASKFYVINLQKHLF